MNIFRLSKKNRALYGHKVLLADRVTFPSDTMLTLSGNEVIEEGDNHRYLAQLTLR
jgi:hypothetical protein